MRLDHVSCNGERKAETFPPLIERCGGVVCRIDEPSGEGFIADGHDGPGSRGVRKRRALHDDDTRCVAFAEGRVHQRREGGRESDAIACDQDRPGHAHLESNPAILTLGHAPPEVNHECTEIERRASDGDVPGFDPPQFSHLRDHRCEARACLRRFFKHLALWVRGRTRLSAEEHAHVAGRDSERRPELMHGQRQRSG